MVRTLFRAGIFINFDFFFYIKLLVHSIFWILFRRNKNLTQEVSHTQEFLFWSLAINILFWCRFEDHLNYHANERRYNCENCGRRRSSPYRGISLGIRCPLSCAFTDTLDRTIPVTWLDALWPFLLVAVAHDGTPARLSIPAVCFAGFAWQGIFKSTTPNQILSGTAKGKHSWVSDHRRQISFTPSSFKRITRLSPAQPPLVSLPNRSKFFDCNSNLLKKDLFHRRFLSIPGMKIVA